MKIIIENKEINITSKKGIHRKFTINMLTKLLLDFPCTGAEIGVYKGETTEYLAKCSHIKKLYAIDPWKQDHIEYGDYKELSKQFKRSNSHGKSLDVKNWDELYEYVKHRLSPYESVEIIRENSNIAYTHIGQKLDFVFLDGDHSYESVQSDIYLWSTKIKPSGILMGHDYCKKSVKKAVDEYFSKYNHFYTPVSSIEENQLVNSEQNTVWWRQKISEGV